MVRNSKIEEEVETDEADGDGTIGAKDNSLEKPTPIAVRSAIETIMDFFFLAESEEMQGCTIKISGMVENELVKNMKETLKRDIYEAFFHSFFFLFSWSNEPILTKNRISETQNK